MSGIAGIIHFDGKPIEPGLIEKMTGAMAHRGPDGIHHWVKGSVALGQCMLRTTPESLEETQPLTNEDRSLVLVMDGRLDNRDELRRALRTHGIALRANTDAELVLGMYQLWGEDSPGFLLGDFAFAVWDARRGTLFCARDHFGVKPFYYFSQNRYLAFASDEEAFFGLPDVSTEPNEDRIAANLVHQFDGGDFNRSWLKDIVKLPPGKSLAAGRSGQTAVQTYWQLEPLEESRFASDLECEETFRSIFSEAVRCRLRTVGNPALMLSGGMDSASIAGMARRILAEMPHLDLYTFSMVSDDAGCTETRNIRAIVKGYEKHATLVSIPSFQGIIVDRDLANVAWTHAHPVGNSIPLPSMMYLAAARSGNRVMYDGIDGDLVTYTPLNYMGSLLRSGAWCEAWAEACQASVNNTYLRHLSPLSIFSKGVTEVYTPSSVKWIKQRIRSVSDSSPFGRSLVSPDFAASIRLEERLKEQQSLSQSVSQLSDQEKHIRALTPSGIARGMEGFDRVAARYGVEARHPWSDKRLVSRPVRLYTFFLNNSGHLSCQSCRA